LENINLEKNDCKKEKELFASMLLPIIGTVALMFFVFAILKSSVGENEKVRNAFENNIELICYAKIVSKDNGYKYDDKRDGYITNGVDIFLLSRCDIK
jgi:hypothetical protein